VLGVVLVAIALGLVVAGLLLSTLAGVILAGLGVEADGTAATSLAMLAGLLAPVALTTLVYATIPRRRLPPRVILLAGTVAGLLISGFSAVFEFIAPRLVGGSLALFGSFVTLFAALIWLGIVVQILLLGAAWMEVMTRETPDGAESARTAEETAAPPTG
jgi:uncharacterized BrkB/YihY/UPF0761 family membrane protein